MKKYSRRKFLRASLMTGGAAALAACQQAGPAAAPTATTGAAAAPAADLPFEIAPEALNPFNLGPAEVDGVFFSGGFGHEYIKYAASLMEKAHPDIKVNVTPVQRVGDTLRPRFVGGNPPDVIDNSGAGQLDNAALVADGQLADLAELMEAPAVDTPGKKFKDTLIAGTQDDLIYDGVQRGINLTYSAYGVCYSQKLFDENGWTYPATWEDMVTFCDQVKKDGKIAPWTHQAKYPWYAYYMVLVPLMYSAGGNDLLIKIDNLEPEAWKDPAVLHATENFYMLYDKGWLLDGTAGLDHTGSQAEFYKGNAVFIPCGGWLENEMKTILPADFVTMMGNCPPLADGVGSKVAAEVGGGEPYVVPEKAAHKMHGFEFLRFLMTKESGKYFAENVLSISATMGSLDNAQVSPFMTSQVAMGQNSEGQKIQLRIPSWYTPLAQGIEQQVTELLTGKIKPADFVNEVQKASDNVAKDSEIKKYKRES